MRNIRSRSDRIRHRRLEGLRKRAVDGLLCHFHDVDVLAVHVEPGAADDEDDVLRKVETGGDGGKTEEEEEDGVYSEDFKLAFVFRNGDSRRSNVCA